MMKVVDLLYINEAAKALKQKQFLFYRNCLYGVTNNNYMVYLPLDPMKLSCDYYNQPAIKLTTRELSAFCKKITIETEFPIYQNNQISINDTMLIYELIQNVDIDIRVKELESHFTPPIDVTEELSEMKLMKMADGVFKWIKHGYFMLLPISVFPLTKPDKIHFSMYDNTNSSFVTRFSIVKKKFNVIIFLAFIKM